jgi:glycosyltransferase involved in cell wall biosynthesis
LTRCLSAVALLDPAPSQVIVVDNSDGDEDTKEVARKFGARYALEPNAGLNRARKRGLAESQTDTVAFLDDDAVPDAKWLVTYLASSAQKKSTRSTGKVLDIDSAARKSRPKEGKPN